MKFDSVTEIELAVAYWFGIRTHIIVPNLSWGMLPYECDLAVLPFRGNYLYEVEIKISKSDLIRDKKKHKWKYYDGFKVRKLWFAIPEKIQDSVAHIPERAGILIISDPGRFQSIGKVTEIRKPKIDGHARKLTIKDKYQLARLAAIRLWPLKVAIKNRNILEDGKLEAQDAKQNEDRMV